MNKQRNKGRSRSLRLVSCAVMLAAVAACGGKDASSSNGDKGADEAAATDESPVSEPSESVVSPAPTTEAPPPPDLSDGLLQPQEMQMIFTAEGNVQELAPDHMLQISACGSAKTFAKVKPESSLIGVYQSEQKDAYWAYIGYYPGKGDAAFAAARTPRHCSDYKVTNPGAGLDPYPVVTAKAAKHVKGTPEHSQISGFADSQGGNYHVAYLQKGDYVLELFYYTGQGFSDVGMKSYLGYALGRFNHFTKDA